MMIIILKNIKTDKELISLLNSNNTGITIALLDISDNIHGTVVLNNNPLRY